MTRIEESVIVPLDTLEIWELMRDLELRPDWDATIIRVTRRMAGPRVETARLYYLAPLFMGLWWRWEGEYVSFLPPHRTSVRMDWGSHLRPFKSLVRTWLLQSHVRGNLVRIIVSFEPRLPLPLLDKIMAWRMRWLLVMSLVELGAIGKRNDARPKTGHK